MQVDLSVGGFICRVYGIILAYSTHKSYGNGKKHLHVYKLDYEISKIANEILKFPEQKECSFLSTEGKFFVVLKVS